MICSVNTFFFIFFSKVITIEIFYSKNLFYPQSFIERNTTILYSFAFTYTTRHNRKYLHPYYYQLLQIRRLFFRQVKSMNESF